MRPAELDKLKAPFRIIVDLDMLWIDEPVLDATQFAALQQLKRMYPGLRCAIMWDEEKYSIRAMQKICSVAGEFGLRMEIIKPRALHGLYFADPIMKITDSVDSLGVEYWIGYYNSENMISEFASGHKFTEKNLLEIGNMIQAMLMKCLPE